MYNITLRIRSQKYRKSEISLDTGPHLAYILVFSILLVFSTLLLFCIFWKFSSDFGF